MFNAYVGDTCFPPWCIPWCPNLYPSCSLPASSLWLLLSLRSRTCEREKCKRKMKKCGFPTQRPELRGQGIGCYSCRRGTLLIVILCLGKKWFLNGANGIFVFAFVFVFTKYHHLIMINTSCVKLECVLAGIDGDTHRSHCCHCLMFNVYRSLSMFINVSGTTRLNCDRLSWRWHQHLSNSVTKDGRLVRFQDLTFQVK